MIGGKIDLWIINVLKVLYKNVVSFVVYNTFGTFIKPILVVQNSSVQDFTQIVVIGNVYHYWGCMFIGIGNLNTNKDDNNHKSEALKW